MTQQHNRKRSRDQHKILKTFPVQTTSISTYTICYYRKEEQGRILHEKRILHQKHKNLPKSVTFKEFRTKRQTFARISHRIPNPLTEFNILSQMRKGNLQKECIKITNNLIKHLNNNPSQKLIWDIRYLKTARILL